MKVLQYIWFFVLTISVSACYKDLGNYDYNDREEIKISGIDSEYRVIAGLDHVAIEPLIEVTDPDAEYDYCWYVYESNTQGYVAQNDTIARVRNIDYLVGLTAKKWKLIFCVKNLNTGYTAYAQSSLSVVTKFSRGWYVSTDDGVNSDISLFYTSNQKPIIPDGRVAHNVLSTINGMQTNGTNGVFAFLHDYKTWSDEENKFVNTRVLIHTTNEGMSIIDNNSFRVVHTIKDIFFDEPDNLSPTTIFSAVSGLYMNNKTGLYTLHTMTSNSGQFGVPLLNPFDDLAPYQLSKFFISAATPVFFDELTGSFMGAPNYGAYLYKVKDSKDSEMSATNTGKRLLYMQCRSFYKGIAIMQDINDPSLKIIGKIEDSSTNSFLIDNDTIDVSDKIYNATLFGQNYSDEDLIYFCVGNEIWSRNLKNGFERQQYIAPGDEKIVSISHKKQVSSGLNHIAIASQNGDNYTVRLFTKQAGNLDPEPEIVISGEGYFSDIMFVSTKVGSGSYSYLSPWSK